MRAARRLRAWPSVSASRRGRWQGRLDTRPWSLGGSMSVFVLVSGGWSGGWARGGVASRLRQAGDEVHTATLTGLGERAHVRTMEPATFPRTCRTSCSSRSSRTSPTWSWSDGAAAVAWSTASPTLFLNDSAGSSIWTSRSSMKALCSPKGGPTESATSFKRCLTRRPARGGITAPTQLDPEITGCPAAATRPTAGDVCGAVPGQRRPAVRGPPHVPQMRYWRR